MKDSPVNNLKSIVLTIDWEISEEIITQFITEIDRLYAKFKNDEVLYKFVHRSFKILKNLAFSCHIIASIIIRKGQFDRL